MKKRIDSIVRSLNQRFGVNHFTSRLFTPFSGIELGGVWYVLCSSFYLWDDDREFAKALSVLRRLHPDVVFEFDGRKMFVLKYQQLKKDKAKSSKIFLK